MYKVLLVEDNQALIDIYNITFTHENFAVEIAHDGEECLQRVAISKPDIILLDVMMPKLNGIETLTRLKANDETKTIPVIMLSNIAENTEESHTKELGAEQYLIKSHYLPLEIVKIVKDTIMRSNLRNQSSINN